MGFNMPLLSVVSEDELSPKTLPAEQSFLFVPGDNLVVTALKKADQGDGIVARFFNETGESTETSVNFLGEKWGVRPVNMLEEPTSSGNEQTLRVLPFEIDTVEIPAAPKGAK
jgi:alpha-mannosidase